MCSTFDSIIAALHSIVDGDDRHKAVESSGIYLQVNSFKFLATLIIFWRILFYTKRLSDHLQNAQINMGKAADLVMATLETLQEFRSDQEWDKMYQYISDVAALHNVNIAPMRSQRPRRQLRTPSRLNDGVIMETTGNRLTPSMTTVSDDYKVSLYYPVLDAIIAEFEKRFGSKNLELMKAIQCCHPESPNFLEVQQLMPLVTYYQLDKESIGVECTLAKRTLKDRVNKCQ